MANWSEINVGLREKNILSLAIVKNRIFVATAHCGLYCYENGGATWYAVNNGIPNTGKSSFQISFAVRDTILFTGIWETGIYLTNDYGQNWVSVGDGLSQEVINSIYCLAADSQSIYIGGYGIYYSNDDGQNWKAMNDGLDLENRSLIVTINIRDTTFFAGDISYGVFRSTKNNPKWIPVNNGLPMSSFGFIYRFIKNDITCMASIGQYLLVGLLDRGIFLTEDNGNNWIEVSEELSNPPVFSMLINDSDVFVGLYGNIGQYTEDNNNGGISKLILLSEDGRSLKTWNIAGKVSVLIGRNTKDNEVDIDLSDAEYSELVSRQHAVLNFSKNKWYIEDVGSSYGSGLKKVDEEKFKLESETLYEVNSGDTLYIANTKILVK